MFTNRSRWHIHRPVSTKHIRTAFDLVRFKAALRITCGRCGNAQTVSGFDVAKIAGNRDLDDLQHRLKCSLCGAREAKLVKLLPPPPRN